MRYSWSSLSSCGPQEWAGPGVLISTLFPSRNISWPCIKKEFYHSDFHKKDSKLKNFFKCTTKKHMQKTSNTKCPWFSFGIHQNQNDFFLLNVFIYCSLTVISAVTCMLQCTNLHYSWKWYPGFFMFLSFKNV